MNRHDIISEAILKPRHSRYLPLTYSRFLLISKVKELITPDHGDIGAIGNACSWVLCTRSTHDPEVVAAMASEDPVAALGKLWEDALHVSEVIEFKEWFDGEFLATEMSATVAKPDSAGKKPIASEAQNPTT